MSQKSLFTVLSKKASYYSGHPAVFTGALALIVLWGISGPVFGFNDTWQLVINTGTTIITFLMVFLIQSTQNRDTMALQLKLDELIRVTKGAQEILIDLEELGEDRLSHIREQYANIACKARSKAVTGQTSENIYPLDIKAVCDEEKDLS